MQVLETSRNTTYRVVVLSVILAALTLLSVPEAKAGFETVVGAQENRSNLFFDRSRRLYFTQNSYTNTTGSDLLGALRIVVEDSNLPVLNGDGLTAGGKTFFAVTVTVTDGLSRGETTNDVRIEFQRARIRPIYTIRLENDPPPAVEILTPVGGLVTAATSVDVTGTVDDDTAAVTVNGVPAIQRAGSYIASGVPLADEGLNVLTALAVDPVGNSAPYSITVIRDTTPPTIDISSPQDGAAVSVGPLQVTGNVSDVNLVSVDVNALPANISDGTYSTSVQINEGSNTISAVAIDAAGNTTTAETAMTGQQFFINADDFPNGVAAGDVRTERVDGILIDSLPKSSVVLWARASFEGKVRFEYGRDPTFAAIDGAMPMVVDDPMIPAKAEFDDLLPGTQYYYRVCRDRCPPLSGWLPADVPSFRTPYPNGLSAGKHGLKFGVSSCWRGDMRPFVSIKNVPERDLDFFVALGDTVYADSGQTVGPRATTLSQFRNKHRQAYSQENSPADNIFALARASTALYATVDDHEVVNDFAGGAPPSSQTQSCECLGNRVLNSERVPGGCPWNVCFCDPDNDQNPYQPGDPKYDPDWIPNCDRPYINETDLYEFALQAFHEYNPIRQEKYAENGDTRTAGKPKLYRHRRFGKDAALFMLDTRSFRDEASTQLVYDAGRTMLGKAQLDEFLSDLEAAEDIGITWKFVLVPEPIQYLADPVASAQDRFEGYAYERGVILNFIEARRISNVVFIAGDIHGTVVNNLTYETNRRERQRYSASWEISTGAAAYSKGEDGPLGPSSPVIGTGGEPREYNGKYDKALDLTFQSEMDKKLRLFRRPQTGFSPVNEDRFGFNPKQEWNRSVPALRKIKRCALQGGGVGEPCTGDDECAGGTCKEAELHGSYVAAHTFGWTEFDIDADSQYLTVTTWGTDWYRPPSDNEVKKLVLREPFIVSHFEVKPTSCDNDGLLEGERCGEDDECKSCICNQAGLINRCAPIGGLGEGESCRRDKECSSSICQEAGIINTARQQNSWVTRQRFRADSGLVKFG